MSDDQLSAGAGRSLDRRARRRFPGGSSRTTLGAVPPPQRYALRGRGARLIDVDGHELIDLHCNASALVHGYGFAPAVAAARAALESGSAFGLPTAAEVELADLLAARVGWAERWRFTGSGGEAAMAAVRAARARSGRAKLVRFAGCYHGGWDALAAPGELGVPEAVSAQRIDLPVGDADGLERVLAREGGEVACVLLDLMPNRAGLEPAAADLVRRVRECTLAHGVALILDEVITFRLATGGLQSRYGIEPDLVVLGKLIGGGLPVGALGGRPEWMDVFDPGGAEAVPLAGTFAANPVSMSAGIAAVRALDAGSIGRIDRLGERLRAGLAELGCEVSGAGSLAKLRSPEPKALWPALYERGVLIAADGLMSISTAIDEDTLAAALEAFAAAL